MITAGQGALGSRKIFHASHVGTHDVVLRVSAADRDGTNQPLVVANRFDDIGEVILVLSVVSSQIVKVVP